MLPIIKIAFLLHKKSEVDNVVLTCVLLQNMLHDRNGLGEWESGFEWGHHQDGLLTDRGNN